MFVVGNMKDVYEIIVFTDNVENKLNYGYWWVDSNKNRHLIVDVYNDDKRIGYRVKVRKHGIERHVSKNDE